MVKTVLLREGPIFVRATKTAEPTVFANTAGKALMRNTIIQCRRFLVLPHKSQKLNLFLGVNSGYSVNVSLAT
jgi:hypothetical protein